MGQSPDSKTYNDNGEGFPLIQGKADITNNRRTSPRKYTSKAIKFCDEGDILLTVRAPVGAVAKASSKCCIGRGVSSIKGDDYVYYYLQYMEDKWHKIQQGSTFDSISFKDIYSLKIPLKKDDKEKIILKILKLIDSKIEVQIKIIEDLKVLKKSIINQFLFNEQIKCNQIYLKDILVERNLFCIKDDTFPHATLSKDGIHPKSERYDRDFLVKNSDKKYKVSYLNDICYNPANLKFGVIALNKLGPCIISPIYVTYSIKSGYNPKLLEMIMTNERFINKARKYEQGTVYERMSVSSSDMLSLKIAIPPFDIQEKIIKYINSLDIKIKVETSLYNLYLKQKEYLLNNLFI